MYTRKHTTNIPIRRMNDCPASKSITTAKQVTGNWSNAAGQAINLLLLVYLTTTATASVVNNTTNCTAPNFLNRRPDRHTHTRIHTRTRTRRSVGARTHTVRYVYVRAPTLLQCDDDQCYCCFHWDTTIRRRALVTSGHNPNISNGCRGSTDEIHSHVA